MCLTMFTFQYCKLYYVQLDGKLYIACFVAFVVLNTVAELNLFFSFLLVVPSEKK
jgi:hypothetical protein